MCKNYPNNSVCNRSFDTGRALCCLTNAAAVALYYLIFDGFFFHYYIYNMAGIMHTGFHSYFCKGNSRIWLGILFQRDSDFPELCDDPYALLVRPLFYCCFCADSLATASHVLRTTVACCCYDCSC